MEDLPSTTAPPPTDALEDDFRRAGPGIRETPDAVSRDDDLRRSVLPRAFEVLPPVLGGETPAEPPPDATPEDLRPTRPTVPLHGPDRSGPSLPRDLPLYFAAVGDRYRILERVGAGGMAEIYRVEHLDLGKQFALKIIAPDLALRESIRDLFYREARIMSQLDHPNIVEVTDFGVDPKRGAFIVMELLQGEALRTRLQREGGLANNLVVSLGIQIAEGLDYLHRANLLHCDIKSENVFLCQPASGQPGRITAKLIDFGLSRSRAASSQHASGSIRGTPHYLAPELIRGEPSTPSMDIYAFGVLLYEMATGTCPFGGELDAVVNGHLMQPVPPIGGRRATALDSRLEALIYRALEKQPEQRQPSMGQMLYELRTVADMLGLSSRRASRAPRSARSPSSPTLHRIPAAEVGHCGFCPLPTFRADRAGVILSANPAFAAFVGKPAEVLRGRRLADTRLAAIYPGLAADLEAVAASFAPVQRTLSYHPTRTSRVSVLATVLPEDSQGRPVLCGVLVPLLEPGGH